DYSKKFLIEPDVEELKKYDHLIDDDINTGHFNFFNKSLEIIDKRIDEAQAYYTEILEKPFDFSLNDSLQLDPEKLSFSKNQADLKEAWRKLLKYQTLVQITDMKERQEKAREKSDTVKIKNKAELEIDARKKVLKSNNDYFRRLKEVNRNDRISAYFNAITAMYDPHTEYFAPKDKANFDIGMSGQLEGIGAQLQEKDGFIKVSNIVPGSASYRQGELKVGDVILKVAQGPADPVDITDMRMDEAVQLIRGKKGTEVRLTVRKPDASIVIIPIIRDIVVIEETYAQSVILNGKRKIGYIKLPEFYADFSGKGGRSSAKDVRKELQKLKDENVEGVILDLRYNGGGSLPDVVEMAGLFIDKGPVVQVKQKIGTATVLEDKDPGVFYDGPLTILVNSNSASASEIMAAAIQDYKRGVIIGTSPSTFGKGTVQRFYDLDDYLPPQYANIKPLGSVKITMQKFYRINGDATQLKGVIPDIVLPDPYYLLDQGEKEQDYPMAWDEIAPAKYTPLKPDYSISKLKENSENRVKNSAGFELLNEAAIRLRKQKDNTMTSLNYDKYMADQKEYKAETKKMESLDKEIPGVEVIPLKVDAVAMANDTVRQNKAKDWYKAIKKDIYLHESIAIMNDIKK
ncbi:MAG TPA: carboxy terminal-processing peptidase, partial [Bacteroidia bacterium]|nr:carboxy terminal-processing peptidase [Bacteroidia bacterium]